MVIFKSSRVHSEQTFFRDLNYDTTKNITRFLNLIYFNGFTRNSSHRIVKCHSKAELGLVLIIVLTYNFGSLYLRSLYTWPYEDWNVILLLNNTYTVIGLVNTVSIICRNLWLDIDVYRVFYKYYQIIDSITNMNKEKYYQKAKLKATAYFYTMVLTCIALATVHTVVLNILLGTMGNVAHLNSTINAVASQYALMYLFIKILIFERKFSAFTEKVTADVSIRNRVWEVDRTRLTKKVLDYKKCYQLFIKQYELLQKTDAVFAAGPILCTLCLFVGVVVLIHDDIDNNLFEIGIVRVCTATLIFMSYGMLTALARQVELIAKSRTKLHLHLEAVIAHRVMGASERSAVESLVKQVCRQPLHFSVYGRFPLNYRMLQIMISTTITYSVVSIQLQK